MPDDQTVTKRDFETLLDWLDRDRESAGQKYERIRQRLIKIFAGRGCHEAERLADETIDRVAMRASMIAPTYEGEPAHYFYGVAQKMHFEWLRAQRRAQKAGTETARVTLDQEKGNDEGLVCLRTCLNKLPPADRRLLLIYYKGEKKARIERRQRLADELAIRPNALHMRIKRLKSKLAKCVAVCMAGQK